MHLHAFTFVDEDGRHIARCLEYDFIGESETEDGAVENLVLAIEMQLRLDAAEGRAPFAEAPTPSPEFLRWAQAHEWEARGYRRGAAPPEAARVLPRRRVTVAVERQAAAM